MHFEEEHVTIYSSTTNKILKSIQVDSFQILNSDTLFFLKELIDRDSMANVYNYHLNCIPEFPTKSSIFGKRYLKTHDSLVLLNIWGDSLYFDNNSNMGYSWRLLSSDFNYYLTVDSLATMNLNGGVDSVKYLKIEKKDTLGNQVHYAYSGNRILISKRYGFLSQIDWREFPMNTVISNDTISRKFVNTQLLRREMYDYSVGDEYQISTKYLGSSISRDPRFFDRKNLTSSRILSKRYSTSTDTVFYTMETKTYYEKALNIPSFPNYTISYDTINSIDTIHLRIDSLNKKAVPSLTDYPYFRNDSNIGETTLRNYQYNGRLHLSLKSDPYSRIRDTLNNLCWRLNPSYYSSYYHAIKGVCVYSEYHDYNLFSQVVELKNIVYFKKGNEVWGRKRLMVNIKEVPLKEKFLISPNPTYGQITIPQVENLNLIQLYNMQGQLVSSIRPQSNTPTSLHIEGAPGMYFVQLQSKDGSVKSLKILKR